MSGSPKRSQAILSAERRLQVEREEQKRQAEAHRREQLQILAGGLSECETSVRRIQSTRVFPELQAARDTVVMDLQRLRDDSGGQTDPAVLITRLGSLLAKIGQYERRANEEEAEQLRARRQAELALRELRAILDGDEFSAIAAVWFPERAAALQNRLKTVTSALAEGRASIAESQANTSVQEARRLVEEARLQEHREREREAVVDALISAMSEMGFAVSEPCYQSDSRDSGVVVDGVLPSGKGLGAIVHIGGAVEYVTEGYETLSFTDADEHVHMVCADAEASLLELHRIMSSGHGVAMSPPEWDGKPDKPRGAVIDGHLGAPRTENHQSQTRRSLQ